MYAASSEINGQEDLRSAAMIFNVLYENVKQKYNNTTRKFLRKHRGRVPVVFLCLKHICSY